MTSIDELTDVWPEHCDLSELDVEAVEALAGAVAQLCRSLGAVRAGYLLFALGRKIGLQGAGVDHG